MYAAIILNFVFDWTSTVMASNMFPAGISLCCSALCINKATPPLAEMDDV